MPRCATLTIGGSDWDDGNWPKSARHGVSRREVEDALLSDPSVLPDRTDRTEEVRLNAVGRNREGRCLFIVVTPRRRADQTVIRPISARYMHAKVITHDERRTQG